jgi:hypothetical protein
MARNSNSQRQARLNFGFRRCPTPDSWVEDERRIHSVRLSGHRRRPIAMPGSVEFPRTLTREILGTISFRSSVVSADLRGKRRQPVMFPPGRARLATNRVLIGSLSAAITIGILAVPSLAARVSLGPAVTITSTSSPTSSAASARSRSVAPHIGTRTRCFVLLCSQARADLAEWPRNEWTH